MVLSSLKTAATKCYLADLASSRDLQILEWKTVRSLLPGRLKNSMSMSLWSFGHRTLAGQYYTQLEVNGARAAKGVDRQVLVFQCPSRLMLKRRLGEPPVGDLEAFSPVVDLARWSPSCCGDLGTPAKLDGAGKVKAMRCLV